MLERSSDFELVVSPDDRMLYLHRYAAYDGVGLISYSIAGRAFRRLGCLGEPGRTNTPRPRACRPSSGALTHPAEMSLLAGATQLLAVDPTGDRVGLFPAGPRALRPVRSVRRLSGSPADLTVTLNGRRAYVAGGDIVYVLDVVP